MNWLAGGFFWGHKEVGVALLVATIFLAGGCDSGGKRDSLFQGLTGATWELQRVQLDGSSFRFAEQTVQFTFASQDDGRTFRLSRIASGDTTTVTGRVGVPRENVLSMTGEFALEWRFTFEKPDDLSDSVQFRLERATEGSVPAFLRAIGLSGSVQQTLVMDLVRESE